METERNAHSVESLVEHVRAMPMADQLDVLGRLVVAILPGLEPDERHRFIDDLNIALSRALPTSDSARH